MDVKAIEKRLASLRQQKKVLRAKIADCEAKLKDAREPERQKREKKRIAYYASVCRSILQRLARDIPSQRKPGQCSYYKDDLYWRIECFDIAEIEPPKVLIWRCSQTGSVEIGGLHFCRQHSRMLDRPGLWR